MLLPNSDVVNNDVCVEILVNGETTGPGEVLPRSVHVIIECDESGRVLDGYKRHDVVRPLSRIRTGECKFGLQVRRNSNLVITQRSVKQPQVSRRSKGHIHGGITLRDGVGDWRGDLIQQDIIHTKAPH